MGQSRHKPPAFLTHDVPVSLAPRIGFRFPQQRLKHISGHFSSARSLHDHPFYKIETLVFPQWFHHTQVERAEGGQPCICVFHSAWFSPWFLLTSLQNEPPPPPTATPTWWSWALRTSVPSVKADFMVCNSFFSLPWLSLPSGAYSPIMCKDNQCALLFFYLPNRETFALPFETPPMAFLNLFLDMWKCSRQKSMPGTDKALSVFIVGRRKQSVLMWKEHSHMPGCSMASFNLEKGNKHCR